MTSRSHTFAKLVHPALSPGHRIASCLNQTVAAKSYSLLSHCYNKIRAEQRRNQSTFTAALTAVHNAFSDPSKGDPHSLAVGDPLRTVAKELNFQVKNLRNLIGSGHPALDTVAKYYTRSEGKYVRPTLVLLMSRATSFAPKTSRDTGNKATDRLVDTPLSPNIILSDSRSPSTEISVTSNAYENNDPTILSSQRRLAEITELIHIASLLHDDVIDHSVSRRSEPSANVAFGNKMAVLAGDFLLGRASVALARLRDPQVVELLATVIANLVEGEFMQLRNTAHDEKNPAWSDDALSYYLHKTYLKSASLISKSCRAAALLGNSAPEIVEAAYLYGKNIGLAFQLVDDMLDYTTSCSELGKPAGADLELGLATAPLLFAWKDYPELGVLAGRKFSSEGDVQRARDIVSCSTGVEQTRALAQDYVDNAIRAIDGFPASNAKDELIQMLDISIRLRRAIISNDLSLVQRIIAHHPHVIQNPDFEDGSNTSLHISCKKGHFSIVELLVDAGHEEDGITRNADWDTPLLVAIKTGRTEIAEMLISRFPRCVPWKNRVGMDALMLSSCHGTVDLIPLLLSNVPPASPTAYDNDGNTALHHASAAGELKSLRLLLQAGAAPFAQNAYSWTPIAYSSTVAAEVYFKNLVAEFEKRRVEGLRAGRDGRGLKEQEREQRHHQQLQQQQRNDLMDMPNLKVADARTNSNLSSSNNLNCRLNSIRLVTEGEAMSRNVKVEPPSGVSPHGSNRWSPVAERRRPMTPTTQLTEAWSPAKGVAARPRASTGN